MLKLNFGCGNRISKNWINIDFHKTCPEVRRVNLLKKWPFPDRYFDIVYSSHVLEHFAPEQVKHILSETYRVMKHGATLRVVVPDLESTCREYINLLDSHEDAHFNERYEWIVLELLDQLTRTTPTGIMGDYLRKLKMTGSSVIYDYVNRRSGLLHLDIGKEINFFDKIKSLTLSRIYNKMIEFYIRAISLAFPAHIRSQVMIFTSIGERHRWMYDRYGLSVLLNNSGFKNYVVHNYNTTSIEKFLEDFLDNNPDGSSYKKTSLYVEVIKP